ncbi:MAG: ABC transporter permease [Salinibacter sp.]|uniref:ABC transporter permease n=1 Tax=Salinibacter sp. TaxID=2065818 RepID=UPI0035D3DA52
MFGGRAFRTWPRVLAGACGVSILFFVVMVMAEQALGDRVRITRAGLLISAAAFVGYIAVSWIIRLDETHPD